MRMNAGQAMGAANPEVPVGVTFAAACQFGNAVVLDAAYPEAWV